MAFTHLASVEALNASYSNNGNHSMRPDTVESIVVPDVSLGLTGRRQIRQIGMQAVDLLVRVGRDGFDPKGNAWLLDIEADPDQIGYRPRMNRVKAVVSAAKGLVSDGVRVQSGGSPYLLVPKLVAAAPVEPLMEYPVLRLPMVGERLAWMGDALMMPQAQPGQHYVDMPSIKRAQLSISN